MSNAPTPLQRFYSDPERTAEVLRAIRQRSSGIDYSIRETPNNARNDWIDARLTAQLEQCFREAAHLLEIHGLLEARRDLMTTLQESKELDRGLLTQANEDFDECVIASAYLQDHIDSFLAVVDPDEKTTTRVPLGRTLRQLLYALCDRSLTTAIDSEASLHSKSRTILKVTYPDLRNKPALSKPLKNFEADFGIPSIHTLIELKYLDRKLKIGPFVDQILADVTGYRSTQWRRLFVVIYETERFVSIDEWTDAIESAAFPDDIRIVVLPGLPPKR